MEQVEVTSDVDEKACGFLVVQIFVCCLRVGLEPERPYKKLLPGNVSVIPFVLSSIESSMDSGRANSTLIEKPSRFTCNSYISDLVPVARLFLLRYSVEAGLEEHIGWRKRERGRRTGGNFADRTGDTRGAHSRGSMAARLERWWDLAGGLGGRVRNGGDGAGGVK